MKHLENYKPLIYKPKKDTFFFINGNVKDVYNTLKELSNNYLNMKDSIDMEKTINRIEDYINAKSLGLFIYYSRFGFSFSIIEDLNHMFELYKIQRNADIYEYVGELIIDNNQIIFDLKNKKLWDDTIKYNL